MKRILHLSSGQGPEECCWVVSRLLHHLMYQAEKNSLRCEVREVKQGKSEGTLRSAKLVLEGDEKVLHFVEKWQGVTKWIGTSMFRPMHRRKNWFVQVKSLQPLSQDSWDLNDIVIETMRASGPGGQHVNKAETAIRITHSPTGISVVSQDERSQYLNKRMAMIRLQAQLKAKWIKEKAAKDSECWQQHNALERGNAAHVFTGRKFILKK